MFDILNPCTEINLLSTKMSGYGIALFEKDLQLLRKVLKY